MHPRKFSIKKYFRAFLNTKQELQDLNFMGDVDSARIYRGSPIAYYLSFGLLAGFILFMIWINFSERDEVTQASGQIIPSQGVQPIQSKDDGIIKEILVTENELVEKDALLAVVSNIRALGDYEEMTRKKIEYELSLQRLRAEQTQQEPQFTDLQLEMYPEAVLDQDRLFRTRKEQFDGESRQLQATLEQRELELTQSKQRREQYEQQLLLLQKQEKQIQPLVKQGAYSPVEYLTLKQRVVTMESDLKTLFVTIDRTESSVEEARSALENSEPVRQAEIAKDMNSYRQELNSITQRLNAGTDLVKNAELRSLVRGTVKRILLREEAVVRSAELIMEIVPSDDALEIDAKFSPQQRGFLKEGQNATVKISAYDSSVYGSLAGTLASISPDTIEDTNGEPWYMVRFRTNSTRLPYEGKDLDIKVGMTVIVDVVSGKKSIFSYLVKPFFKAQREASVVLELPEQNTKDIPTTN